jgi:hypothetical protein
MSRSWRAHALDHTALLIDRDQRRGAVRRAAVEVARQLDQCVEIASLGGVRRDRQVALEQDRRADSPRSSRRLSAGDTGPEYPIHSS